jgi:S-adenosyl-L-methionine hydrolase (adenosine-forming)
VTRPIVFITDYGRADEFVGVCQGVMTRIAPGARVIDLTHDIPRQDVMRGALILARATTYMPEDAVYVAVVDPGVGTERRSIAVEVASGALLVGPDNGLLSLAWTALGGAERAAEIADPSVMLFPVSKTFHGRDVFAPAGAHLAAGVPLEDVGPALEPSRLRTLEMPGPMVAAGALGCRVIGVDGFGNVQLNARPPDMDEAGLGAMLQVAGRTIPRVGMFADVPEGVLAAIVDSQGYVALVVNHGSAAELLSLKDGAAVILE